MKYFKHLKDEMLRILTSDGVRSFAVTFESTFLGMLLAELALLPQFSIGDEGLTAMVVAFGTAVIRSLYKALRFALTKTLNDYTGKKS